MFVCKFRKVSSQTVPRHSAYAYPLCTLDQCHSLTRVNSMASQSQQEQQELSAVNRGLGPPGDYFLGYIYLPLEEAIERLMGSWFWNCDDPGL